MKVPLLRPRFTLAALTAGLLATGFNFASTVVLLAPLETRTELISIRPWIIGIDCACAAIAVVCFILCAVGRSIDAFVDHDGQ